MRFSLILLFVASPVWASGSPLTVCAEINGSLAVLFAMERDQQTDDVGHDLRPDEIDAVYPEDSYYGIRISKKTPLADEPTEFEYNDIGHIPSEYLKYGRFDFNWTEEGWGGMRPTSFVAIAENEDRTMVLNVVTTATLATPGHEYEYVPMYGYLTLTYPGQPDRVGVPVKCDSTWE